MIVLLKISSTGLWGITPKVCYFQLLYFARSLRITFSEKSPSFTFRLLSQIFQPSPASAMSPASVTAKGISVRLVIHLSLAAMARNRRISKGMRLLSLSLSERACANRLVNFFLIFPAYLYDSPPPL